MLSEAAIYAALRDCFDPEVKLNLVDLGLIFEQVQNRLAGIPDISRVEVELVWEPKWTPHRISEAGRRQLGI